MPALIQCKCVPIFISENISIHSVAVVRVASLRWVCLEMLLVFLAKFFFNLIMVKQSRALASSAKPDQKTLERDSACHKENVRVELGERHLDMIH